MAERFHPSEYLVGELKERKMTHDYFATECKKLGLDYVYILKILSEMAPITLPIALGFYMVFGDIEGGAEDYMATWMRLQAAYDDWEPRKGESHD